MTPTVSVIIPCYKSEVTIRQCVESLQAQTFTNWEAIFIDDVPSTEMLVLMAAYEARDSRINYKVWWKKTNPAHARNRGFDDVKGKYIAFIDADDWWDSTKLYWMVHVLDEKSSVSWCAHYLIQEHNDRQVFEHVYPGHDISIGGIGACMFRKKLLDDVVKERGYLFDEALNRNDDAELILYVRNTPSILIPFQLSHMRMRDDGLANSVSKWENSRIIIHISLRNHCYKLVVVHTILAVLNAVGIDLVKIKKTYIGDIK